MDKYQIRRPAAADAAAVHRLLAEHETEVLGRPYTTLDEVTGLLTGPGFDPGRDGWLAHEPDGDLAGWARVRRTGDGTAVDVDVAARTGEAADLLWGAVLDRVREIAGESGHRRVTADIGIHRDDVIKRATAAAHGFVPVASRHRLRADHGLIPRLFLAGVTVARGDDEGTRRAAHAVYQEGFAGHSGFAPRPFEEWADDLADSGAHDWSQLLLARVHGEPAAMLLGSDLFASEENCGHVRALAVRPRFRGRGLGRLLLTRAFAADADRGRAGTILHVDADGTAPALDLYRSVGMRPVRVADVWRRTL